jgi:hypothetical protein
MATTVVTTDPYTSFTVETVDADWTWTDSFTQNVFKNGMPVWSITFQPGAASDVLSLKNGSAAANEIFPDNALLTTDPQIEYYGGNKQKLFIDFSESTLSAGHRIIVMLANSSRFS